MAPGDHRHRQADLLQSICKIDTSDCRTTSCVGCCVHAQQLFAKCSGDLRLLCAKLCTEVTGDDAINNGGNALLPHDIYPIAPGIARGWRVDRHGMREHCAM